MTKSDLSDTIFMLDTNQTNLVRAYGGIIMKKQKALKITLTTLGILLGIIVLILGAVRLVERIIFKDFYEDASKEFKMPGTADGLVQQGFTYLEDKEIFLVAGYMSNGSASMVYALNKDGEIINKASLKNADGGDYTGHTGGIEVYKNCVYITEGTKDKGYNGGLDVFPLDQILNEAEVKQVSRVTTYNNPAYVKIHNGYMLVGEYYREVDYETLDSHRFTTPNGDKSTALITVFKIEDSNTDNSYVSDKPVAGITTVGAVQGLEIVNDKKIVLSTSWGLSKSQLHVYDTDKIDTSDREPVLIEGADANSTSDDVSIKLYHLDSASFDETVIAPPMAEEMVCLENKLYILNESACNKYIFGKFMSGNYIYAYDVCELD